MNRTGNRVLAVSAALFFCSGALAGIQTAGPTPPKPPAAPKIAKPGAISTTVTANKIVTETITGLNQNDAAAAQAAERYAQVLNSRVFSSLPEKRQNIDLVDVPLKEALRRVLEDSKTPYVIDDDVPNEPRVSIKLTNAPLTTILDALTLSNNIGWRTELKRTKSSAETLKPPAAENKKEDQSGSGAAGRGTRGTFYTPLAVSGTFVTQIHVGKTIKPLSSAFPLRALNIDGPPTGVAQDILRGTVSPQAPQLRVYRWQSQKRTFTCPRCHNNISILHQPEEVKCTKCQRHFEDSWKVCPFDGTKRPEPKNKWRFCPICGKTITLETSWSAPSLYIDPEQFPLPRLQDIEELYPGQNHYFPGLAEDAIGDDHDHGHEPVQAESAIDFLTPFPATNPDLLLK